MNLIHNYQLKIVLAASLFLASCGIGMDVPKVNGYTGQVTLETESAEIASNGSTFETSNYLTAYIEIIPRNGYYLHLNADANYDHNDSFVVKFGQTLNFKTRGGELITFITPADAAAISITTIDHYYRNHYWSAQPVYALSYEDLVKITQSNFIGARLETDKGDMDFAMSNKESDDLKKLASLAIKSQPHK